MTLTAIDSELTLFRPSAYLEDGIAQAEVAFLMRRKQEDRLYCPHCYQRTQQFVEVRYRNSQDRCPHFFHLQSLHSGDECSKFSGESEKHNSIKTKLERDFKGRGASEVIVDKLFVVSDDGQKRKPDLIVRWKEGFLAEAHEVQVSPIAVDELEKRTEDLKRSGFVRVCWYLYGKNYRQEVKLCCEAKGIAYFHVWFEESDVSKPKYKQGNLAAEEQSPKKVYRNEKDKCSFVVNEEGEREGVEDDRPLQVGDRVTNDRGWHGTVQRIATQTSNGNDYQTPDGKYYWVHWREREQHEDKLVRKHPICGHTIEQIWKCEE